MASSRILVGTIRRNCPATEASGYLRIIDWKSQRVMMQSRVPESVHRHRDPNPRGGARGVRGLSAHGDRVVIANTERVFVFDAAWRLRGDFSHPWMGDIHDIFADEDGIWVASCGADLLVKLDWEGRLVWKWDWRRDRRLTRAFGYAHLPAMNPNVDYRDPVARWSGAYDVVHLNGVSRCSEGLLLSFGRIRPPRDYVKHWLLSVTRRLVVMAGAERMFGGSFSSSLKSGAVGQVSNLPSGSRQAGNLPHKHRGRPAHFNWAIVLLREDGRWEILKQGAGISKPNHNIVKSGDELIYNDTNGGRVVSTAFTGGRPDRAVAVPGSPGFARGLALLNGHALVGSQYPAAIYEVDLSSCQVVRRLTWNDQGQETVYGVAVLPPTIGDPPEQLDFQNRDMSKAGLRQLAA